MSAKIKKPFIMNPALYFKLRIFISGYLLNELTFS
jgi:hypothetical protein